MMRGSRLALVALVLGMAGQLLAADARLQGVVVNSAGEPLADVKITLDDPARGVHYEIKSNSKGKFFRRALRPSRYTLVAEHPDYLSHTIEDFVVQAGVERELTLTLKTQDDRRREVRVSQGGEGYAAGLEAFEAEDWQRVVELLGPMVAASPEQAQARLVLAESLANLGRYDEAIPHYRAALEGEPGNAAAIQRLAQALLRSGREQQAVELFQQAEALDPSDPSVSYNIGALLLKEDRLDAAREAFERALERQPDYPPALNGLGRVAYEEGNGEEAERLFRDALRLNRNSFGALYGLGRVYESRGDSRAALDNFRRAVEVDGGSIAARYHLPALRITECINYLFFKALHALRLDDDHDFIDIIGY